MNTAKSLVIIVLSLLLLSSCKSVQDLSNSPAVQIEHEVHGVTGFSYSVFADQEQERYILRDATGRLLAEMVQSPSGNYLRLPGSPFIPFPGSFINAVKDEFLDVWNGSQDAFSIVFLGK